MPRCVTELCHGGVCVCVCVCVCGIVLITVCGTLINCFSYITLSK